MENNSMNEIQIQVISDQRKEVADMITSLTQPHIFFKYSKSQKKVEIVFFNENLQKLIFEINKQTRKVVMITDIYYSEPGFSKELLSKLVKEDLKHLYGMKIITKKRVIELSSMHRQERDNFVKNVNLLLQIMKEWKSTRGLRYYFERCVGSLTSNEVPNKTPIVLTENDFQVIKDTVNELIGKIEYRGLISSNKKLHNELMLIQYENTYLSNQSCIYESQLKDKDRALECTLTTFSYLQHKYYLNSILNRSERTQEYFKSWRKILEFLDSISILKMRSLNKKFLRLVNNFLGNKESWVRISYSGLRPRKLLWNYYLHKFHPYVRSKSLHFIPEVIEEIRKDVYRLPDRFIEVEEALRTICSLNYEVGYCQGMQLVTHFLFTIYNDTSEVIQTLKTLMEPPYYMGEIWKNGFCRLKLAIFQLEILASLKLPYLLEHLKNVEINLDIIVTPWIVTVFTHMMYQQKVSKETIKQIWDMFIVSGWPILIATSMAIFYLCLDKIVGKTLEETLNVFLSVIPNVSINTIKKFMVDPQFLEQLETSFNLQNT